MGIIMKIRIYITVVLLLLFFNTVAQAEITTSILVQVAKKHGGASGRTEEIRAIVYGKSADSGELVLNHSGNDFTAGQWDRWSFSPSDMPNGIDVGRPVKIKFGYLHNDNMDDFCLVRLIVERHEGWVSQANPGKKISSTEFIEHPHKEVCFGNYDRKSKPFRIFTNNDIITAKIGEVNSQWQYVSQLEALEGTGMVEFGVTVGSTRTDEKTTTTNWQVTVETEVKGKAGFLGNGGEMSASVGVSSGQEYGISNTIAKTKSFGTTTKCSVPAAASGVTAKMRVISLYQWMIDVTHVDGTKPVNIPLAAYACVIDQPVGVGFKPVCQPGCCANERCTKCREGNGYEACKVQVNPQFTIY